MFDQGKKRERKPAVQFNKQHETHKNKFGTCTEQNGSLEEVATKSQQNLKKER
jgi:hypothetical protein